MTGIKVDRPRPFSIAAALLIFAATIVWRWRTRAEVARAAGVSGHEPVIDTAEKLSRL